MNIAIISLGCPKNQVDADVFCHALIKAGHQTVADPEQADIIIAVSYTHLTLPTTSRV